MSLPAFSPLPLLASLPLPGFGGQLLLDSPEWLLFIVFIPLILWLRSRRPAPVVVVPFSAAWHRPSFRTSSRWPSLLASSGSLLLILALARPQHVDDRREVRAEGYDLVLAIDISSSMLSEDYERRGDRINRLEAIRPVIQAFVRKRPNDRIGIVVFSGRAYTMAPLTLDHDWLDRQITRLKVGVIEDGTAIGDGLGVALTRLEQAARESKGRRLGAFVILLTDGANNRGTLNPLQASEIAQSRRIPVYTIGAGKEGWVPVPVARRTDGSYVYQQQFSQLDEGLLRVIASQTGGGFFRADDVDTVEKAFSSIDRAQKISFQARSHLLTTELFPWLAGPGLACLLVSALALLPPRRHVPVTPHTP